MAAAAAWPAHLERWASMFRRLPEILRRDSAPLAFWGMPDRTVGLPESALGQKSENMSYLKLRLMWQLVGGRRPP